MLRVKAKKALDTFFKDFLIEGRGRTIAILKIGVIEKTNKAVSRLFKDREAPGLIYKVLKRF